MDYFFEDTFWYEDFVPVPPLCQSAFVSYTKTTTTATTSRTELLVKHSGNGGIKNGNMNKRMLNILRKDWNEKIKEQEPERERCNRHMLNERIRREKQKQNYSGLHSVLPPGTKSDKNSVVATARNTIQEMQELKKMLEKKNSEFSTNLVTKERAKHGGTKIKVRVPNPVSGVDSMIEVLKCLKRKNSETTAIQAKFSCHEFSAVMNIESKIVADEVERAVQRRLDEVEWKFLMHFQEY